MAAIHIDPVPPRCSPGAILAFICDTTKLDRKHIGKIAFVGRGATVEVPDTKAAAMVAALDGARLSDRPVRVRFAGKADFMRRAMYDPAPLKDADRDRFYVGLGMAVGTHEAAFNLRKRGLVEAAAYERNAGSTRLYLQSPRARKWWSRARNTGMDPEFRAIVDAIAKDIEEGAARAPSAGEKSA